MAQARHSLFPESAILGLSPALPVGATPNRQIFFKEAQINIIYIYIYIFFRDAFFVKKPFIFPASQPTTTTPSPRALWLHQLQTTSPPRYHCEQHCNDHEWRFEHHKHNFNVKRPRLDFLFLRTNFVLSFRFWEEILVNNDLWPLAICGYFSCGMWSFYFFALVFFHI